MILFGVAGFFILPPIIKSQAEKRLTVQLGRPVTIGKVRVNPFALSLTLVDLDVKEKAEGGSFVGWRRLYVRFDALASLTGDWVLGAIELDGLHASVVANPDGSFNFSDLLAKFAPSVGPAKPGRPVRIGRLSVSEARVNFDDRSLKRPFSTLVGPLTFRLTNFRTVGARGAPYHFEAVTESGERLSWSGTLSADPVESRGNFELQNIVLKKYVPYFERMSQADVTDGQLSARGSYIADFDPSKRTLTLSDAELHIRTLKVVERSTGKPVAGVEALDVDGLQADAVGLRVSAERVSVAGSHLSVRRAKDGSVNFLSLLTPPRSASAAQTSAVPPAVTGIPHVSVAELTMKDSGVDISDQAVPHSAQLSLGDLQFSLKKFTLADGATMPMHLSFGWAPKGRAEVDGTVVLKPKLEADIKANVQALDLLPLSPYLEQRVNARITQGEFSALVSLHASASGESFAGSLGGDVDIDNFGLVDAAQNKALAGFTRLTLKGLKVSTVPKLSVEIPEAAVSGPYARVRVEADNSLNFSTLYGRASSPTPATADRPETPPRIEVGRVAIDGGNFSFTDLSVEPNVHVSMSEFAGTLTGLSSENLARADVALKGNVGDAGPVQITGKLDPLGVHKFVGLKIDVANVDLLFLSPYVGKYAGYELARGQVVVDSKILVDGDAVESTNVVTLKQFTLGAATPSPSATTLPVRLGVALLKDSDGRIVIDLPVQGSLGNPDFRVGKVVLRVVVNLLTKAAVSPFSLIGSMFGGGGDELAFQEFAPGSSDLLPAEAPKLATLEKALASRPALSLGLEGGYDSAADSYALKRTKLSSLVRRKIWEARHAVAPNIPPPDQLAISPEENAAMIKRLFDAKFPPGTQFGTPLPPPPAVMPPPPVPHGGMIRHLVDLITFKKERGAKAAQKVAARVAAEHDKDVSEAVAAGLPLDQMTGRLAESMIVTNNDLAALASTRAQNVRRQLIEAGHIAANRLFLSKTSGPASPQVGGPRVLLTLE